MKVRRDVAAIPVRSARDTWSTIVELITGADTVDRAQLAAAASVMETIISEEQAARSPIVISGCGARLVIYCVYGEAALELGLSLDRLTWNPTGPGWHLAAPASAHDLTWMTKTLGSRTSRVTVYDAASGYRDDGEEVGQAVAKSFEIDWKGFGSQ